MKTKIYCDIADLRQIKKFNKLTIDTVNNFLKDSKKSKFKI